MKRTYLLAAALALLGCGDRNFDTPQTLDVPRVLAIQAEPPQPKMGESTTLRTLVYMPPEDIGQSATYSWRWCPVPTSAANGYRCPIDQAGFDALFRSMGFGAAPLLDLGTGKTAVLVNPFPASVLARFCANPTLAIPGAADAGMGGTVVDGGLKSVSDCLLVGLPITIYLSISPTSVGTLESVFRVNLPTDDSVPGNRNPVVNGIQATWKDARFDGGIVEDARGSADGGLPPDEAGALDSGESVVDAGEAELDADHVAMDADWPPAVDAGLSPTPTPDAAGTGTDAAGASYGVLLDNAYSTFVPRQKRTKLHLQLPATSSENLTPAQAVVEANHRRTERLDVAWFAEAGDFGGEGEGGHRTGFLGFPDDIDSPFDGATEFEWTLPKSEDYKKPTSWLMVVVRDNRGGVAWTTASASLEPTP